MQPVAPGSSIAAVRRARGIAAEALAAEYLAANGLQLLARNVRCKGGEIDIVCRDGNILAVVEVRQRARHDFGGPLASVTRAKQRKIICAARFLLRAFPAWRSFRMRFDVLALHGLPDGVHRFEWVKDAFRAS
jgi:putative endonuclease